MLFSLFVKASITFFLYFYSAFYEFRYKEREKKKTHNKNSNRVFPLSVISAFCVLAPVFGLWSFLSRFAKLLSLWRYQLSSIFKFEILQHYLAMEWEKIAELRFTSPINSKWFGKVIVASLCALIEIAGFNFKVKWRGKEIGGWREFIGS